MRNERDREQVTDVHSHFLPGIDDGAKDLKTSIEILHQCYLTGVTGIAATPHYYSDVSIARFIEKRDAAYAQIKEILRQIDYPFPIALGAEVYYNPNLIYYDDLRSLCIGNSDYFLLELPFAEWDGSVFRTIESLIHSSGVRPIIAHLERYYAFNGKENIRRILEMDVCIQMNAETILSRDTAKKACKDIRSGKIDFLGSDCHNLSSRPENLAEAYSVLSDYYGLAREAEILKKNGDVLL